MSTSESAAASVTDLQEKIASLEKQLAELAVAVATNAKTKCTENTQAGSEAKPGPGDENARKATSGVSEQEIRTQEAKSGPASRVKIVKKWKNEAGELIEKEESPQETKKSDEKNQAFILRKHVTEQGSFRDDTSEIDIVNPKLWELLKRNLKDYPYHIYQEQPKTLRSPYEAIVLKWEVLEAESHPRDEESSEEKQAREDLSLLLQHISGGASGDPKLDKYFNIRDACLKEKTVYYQDLWTLFPPGTLIFGRPFQNEPQLFVVKDNVLPWPDRERERNDWELICWAYDWTGENFQRTTYAILFDSYEGLKPITALPYYPLDLYGLGDREVAVSLEDLKTSLISRGRRFRELCMMKAGSRLFEYDGDAIMSQKGFAGLQHDDNEDDHQPRFDLQLRRYLARGGRRPASEPPESEAKRSVKTKGRIMVDHHSYFQYGPSSSRIGILNATRDEVSCTCSDCNENEGLRRNNRAHFDSKDNQCKAEWEEEQYLLCPPRVLGYLLNEKQWVQFQVTFTKNVTLDDHEPFQSRLRLDEDNRKRKGDKAAGTNSVKKMLLNLVESHTSTPLNTVVAQDALEVDDIIPGKGKGLVILLYGPPGVGKTSTAETIAMATGKPLFSISVADVGTRARHVEANLARIFSLATRWQAILLIDEADVFLESRGAGGVSSTTERSALVSVFLRVLEYYKGIMFLTTNQIAQFDVAIPSRIHIALSYPHLKADDMEHIVKGFLEPLDEKGLVDDFDGIMEKMQDEVFETRFDGRQLRNIVTTALGLARAGAKGKMGQGKLTWDHLWLVAKNTRAFKTDFAVQYEQYITEQSNFMKKS